MKPICAVCGRTTTPASFIGGEPVGPKCADKLGLKNAASKKSSRIRFVKYKPVRSPQSVNLDLFADEK